MKLEIFILFDIIGHDVKSIIYYCQDHKDPNHSIYPQIMMLIMQEQYIYIY